MRDRGLEVFDPGPALLAESPVYQPETEALLWVDIEGGYVHRKALRGGPRESIDLGQPVGTVMLRRGRGLLYALREGLAVTDDWAAPWRVVAPTDRQPPNLRMNDGKPDRHGRAWVGTMAMDAAPRAGALNRVDVDYQQCAVERGFTVPNGLCWNADDTQMYYIDSELQRVDVYDYDADTGAVRNRRALFEMPAAWGKPDGMTIDDSGCLWVAHFGGGAVRRYTVDGKVDRTLALPVSQVSCCVFGGHGYDELFITTASVGLSDEARAREPLAGAVFVTSPGARGYPADRYRG